MKPLIPLVGWFALATGFVALANDASKTLSERMDEQPDMTRASDLQGKAFQGGPSFKMKEAKTSQYSFNGRDTFETKPDAEVRSFLGIKNPWFGKKMFALPDRKMKIDRKVAKTDEAYPVEAAQSKSYMDSEKAAPASRPVETQPYVKRGSAQGSLDSIADQVKKEMTVEDIREILNKNK